MLFASHEEHLEEKLQKPAITIGGRDLEEVKERDEMGVGGEKESGLGTA